MQALAAKRPENFARVVKPEEKQLLESVLESALGVQRKKPAAKKAATKKVATKKAATKKVAAKKAVKRTPASYRDLF
jgi:topoisomerase IA-like protein